MQVKMNLSESQVKKLLLYTGNVPITQIGLSLLITRLSRKYQNEPSLHVLKDSTNELNTFINKFSSIMVSSYDWIVSL